MFIIKLDKLIQEAAPREVSSLALSTHCLLIKFCERFGAKSQTLSEFCFLVLAEPMDSVCTSVQTKMRKTLNRFLSIHLKITIHQLHVSNFMQKTPVFPEKGLRRVALVCSSCQHCGAEVPGKTWTRRPIAWGTDTSELRSVGCFPAGSRSVPGSTPMNSACCMIHRSCTLNGLFPMAILGPASVT